MRTYNILTFNQGYSSWSIVLHVFPLAGRLHEEKVFTEDDWSDEECCIPYEKSKLRAEKAAWELVKNLPGL